jgi:hypothetical protein
MKTIKYFIFLAVFMMAATGMFAGQVILQQDFHLMVYGGDAVGNTTGKTVDATITPWDINTDPGKVNLPDPVVEKTGVAATTLATQFFGTGEGTATGGGTISDTYKALRGILGWTGSYIFEQPGYVTFGHSKSEPNWLSTPALSNIDGTKNLKVSFKVGRRPSSSVSANTKVTVSVTGAGTITANVGGGEPTIRANAPGGLDFPIATGGVWLEKEITVTGATSETQIKFETTAYVGNSASPGPPAVAAVPFERNFSLDDILIETIEEGPVSSPSIASEGGSDISVYVGTSDGNLYFSNAIPIRNVEIIGLSGRTVVSVSYPAEPRVSLSGIPAGIYLARFTTQEGGIVNKKISLF